MGFWSVLTYAHKLAEQRIQPGDTVIDATVGTGADTLQLARLAGVRGKVYGFDIQQAALDQAKERLQQADIPEDCVTLLLASHANLQACLPPDLAGRISAILFNLGYLPGSDKQIITQPDSTLPALEQSLRLLRPGGLLCVTVYPGHAGGEQEAVQVEDWFAQLSPQIGQTLCYKLLNRRSAPYILALEKK